MHLDNEYYAGELHEDEYHENWFPEGMLQPKSDRVAKPRAEGPGIRQPHMHVVFMPLSTLPLLGRL